MSIPTKTTPDVTAVSPTASQPSPPIVQMLPLVRLVASVCSWVVSLTIRAFLFIFAPLRLLWPMMLSLLSPITVTLSIVTDAVIFVPFSLIHRTISALYPLYVFFAIACLTGAAAGILGRLIVFTVLGVLTHSRGSLQRRKSQTPLPASQPLRRRKRRTVRIQ